MEGAYPHMLLVEDSPVDRIVASKVLEICNIQVTLVQGPQEALNFLDKDEDHDVELILTDCCLTAMTGYDLLTEVKNSPKLNHIPVVIDNPERIKKCLDVGPEDYILKPFKLAHIPRIMSYI